jgi:hypothetical protein
MLYKISLIEKIIDIDDPLLKGSNYDQFRHKFWFKNLEAMLHSMDNQVYKDWVIENTDYVTESAHELLNQVLDLSIQAIKSDECSSLFTFVYNKSNGGFAEVINDAEGGPQQFALRNSFHQVIEKLINPLIESKRAFLNQQVNKIDYTKDSTSGTVELFDGTVIEAECIINCSGIVASQNINFTQGTIDQGRDFVQQKSTMGSTIKTFISYDTPWWRVKDAPEKSFAGYVGAVHNTKVFNEEYPKDTTNTIWFYDVSYQKPMNNEKPIYTLMVCNNSLIHQTFITDNDCIEVMKKGLSEEQVKEIILNHMRYYFKFGESEKPNPEIEKYIGFCWVQLIGI